MCALTPAGNDSLTASAEWCRRSTDAELAAFQLPYDLITGGYRVPGEKTLRRVLGLLDPARLSIAAFAYLRPLLPQPGQTSSGPRATPDGLDEREQRRHHATAGQECPTPRGRAIAVDGKCLRGARRPDGSRVFVLCAITHGDGTTLASREIAAKTNEIPEFARSSTRSTTLP